MKATLSVSVDVDIAQKLHDHCGEQDKKISKAVNEAIAIWIEKADVEKEAAQRSKVNPEKQEWERQEEEHGELPAE